ARSVSRRIPSSGRSRSSEGNSASYGYGATRQILRRATLAGSGPVAQLVEQRTFNPKVAGSIPARPIALSLKALDKAEPIGTQCTSRFPRGGEQGSAFIQGGF